MPIYEYDCAKCGPFEATQRITEAPLKKCERCGGKVQRLISASSFALKGGGWYSDLYSSKKSDASSSKPASKPSEGSAAKA